MFLPPGILPDGRNKAFEGTPGEVWKDGVLPLIKQLNVSRYHSARLPVGKEITERHCSPTAQEFYGLFGLGSDGDKPGAKWGIAPKDLAGVALVGVQELLERIEKLEKGRNG